MTQRGFQFFDPSSYRTENDAWLGEQWGMSQRDLDLAFPWGQDPDSPVAEWDPELGWIPIEEAR